MERPHNAVRRHWPLAASAVCAIAALVLASPMNLRSSSSTLTTFDAPIETSRFISNSVASSQLLAAGLTPEVLAAAGVRAEQAAAMIASGREYLLAHQAELDAAERAVGEARRRATELVRRNQPGAGQTPAPGMDSAQIASELASAVAARAQVRSALRAAACADLSASTRDTINVLLAGSGQEGIPTKFRVVSRSESEWLALREDLTHLRQAQKAGVEPDSQIRVRVLDAESDPAVIAAQQGIEANLSALETAFRLSRAER